MMSGLNYHIRHHDHLLDGAERWMLNDGEHQTVDFHVQSDDYFATLATVLDLLRQQQMTTDQQSAGLLERLVHDLLYLQRHYRIEPKDY